MTETEFEPHRARAHIMGRARTGYLGGHLPEDYVTGPDDTPIRTLLCPEGQRGRRLASWLVAAVLIAEIWMTNRINPTPSVTSMRHS
jgi:hypothetical protein